MTVFNSKEKSTFNECKLKTRKGITLFRVSLVTCLVGVLCAAGLVWHHMWDVAREREHLRQTTRSILGELFSDVEKCLKHCDKHGGDMQIVFEEFDPVPYRIPHGVRQKSSLSNDPDMLVIPQGDAVLEVERRAFETYYGLENSHVTLKKAPESESIPLRSGGFLVYTLPQKEGLSSFWEEKRTHLQVLVCGIFVIISLMCGVYVAAHIKVRRFYKFRLKTLISRSKASAKKIELLEDERKRHINKIEALQKKNLFHQNMATHFERKKEMRFEKLTSLTSVLISSLEQDPTSTQVRFLAKELMTASIGLNKFDLRDFHVSCVCVGSTLENVLSHVEWDLIQKSISLKWDEALSQDMWIETDPHLLELYLSVALTNFIRHSFKGVKLTLYVEQDLDSTIFVLKRKGRGCKDRTILDGTLHAPPFASSSFFEDIEKLLGVRTVLTQQEMRLHMKSSQNTQGNSHDNVIPLFA